MAGPVPDPSSAESQIPDPEADLWLEIALVTRPALAEQAAAVLERFIVSGLSTALPFEQGEEFGQASVDPEGDARVSGYVPQPAWAELRDGLERALQEAVWDGEVPSLELQELRREDWEWAWQAFVRILHFGRLVVRPTSLRYDARPGDVVVHLESGLAFGTGQHESTQLALKALERRLRPGMSVLDVGCGSGILASAAGALGAEQIDAVDIDPLAVEVTRRNLARNGLARRSSVVELAQPPSGKAYDLVVANITAGILSALMPALAAATRPGGICILSGIIDSQVERVQHALATTDLQTASLNFEEIAADGEWRSITATRPPPLPG